MSACPCRCPAVTAESFGRVTAHRCSASAALTTCQCSCSTWRALGHFYHLAIRLHRCHRQATEHTQRHAHAHTDSYTLIIQTVCAWRATGGRRRRHGHESSCCDSSSKFTASTLVAVGLVPPRRSVTFPQSALDNTHMLSPDTHTHTDQYPPAALIVSLDCPYESFLPYSKTNTDNLMQPFLSSYGSNKEIFLHICFCLHPLCAE